MKSRPLGRTGLRTTELGLGTWGLSGDGYGPVSTGIAEAVVARALELGIRCFETCDAYAAGGIETLLGTALASVEDARVVTRIGTDRSTTPPRKNFSEAYLRLAVERSCKRLGRAKLDVLLLHNPRSETLRTPSVADAARTLVAEGVVDKWGASVTTVEAARAALDARADVIEVPYNIFHSDPLQAVTGEILVAGTGVLARSVLCYGLLCGHWTRERLFADGDHRKERWTTDELGIRIGDLDKVRFLVKGDVHTLRGAAVRFALANPVVSVAVLGPRNVLQLDQLVRETGAGPSYLPDADLMELERRLGR